MKKFLYKNTPIYYSDTGSGNAIVLLHGFLENSKMWNFYIPDFSIKNRIIAIDLLGHGQSECLGYIHSMENQADMVFALLNNLKIKKAVFVGHSMGGYVALAFAEMYPVNIGSLVLLNSTSFEDNHERKINRNRAIKAVKLNYINFVRMSISNLFSEENREILEDEIESVKLEALKTTLQGIVAAQEGMKIRKDRTRFLQSALFPILLVLGKKDPVLNYQENKKLIENTAIQLVAFPDGHMSHIENKEDLKLILLDFFKQ